MGPGAILIGILAAGIGLNILSFPLTALAMRRRRSGWKKILSAFAVSTVAVSAVQFLADYALYSSRPTIADEQMVFMLSFFAAIGLDAASLWLLAPISKPDP